MAKAEASRSSRAGWWRRAFVVASASWCGALLVAPLAASQVQPGPVVFGFAYLTYSVGHIVCHQLPDRSFHLWAMPLPVCARCTGIYAGAAIAAVLAACVGDPGWWRDDTRSAQVAWRAFTRRTMADAAHVRRFLLIAAVPTAATLLYEWTTGDMPAHWVRALAGAPLGAAVAWIVREVN